MNPDGKELTVRERRDLYRVNLRSRRELHRWLESLPLDETPTPTVTEDES